MTESFTIGDSLKYSAIHHGKKLIINNWELFDKDWGILKEKAEKWDYLFKETPGILQNAYKCYEKLEAVKKYLIELRDYDMIPDWHNLLILLDWKDLHENTLNECIKVLEGEE